MVLFLLNFFLKKVKLIDEIKTLIDNGEDVYILSAYLTDSQYAFDEKNEWLNRYLQIDNDHRIFVKYGDDKSKYIENGITNTDYLIDDYTKNLNEWREAGGTPIKFLNGINNTKGTYDGLVISEENTDILATIEYQATNVLVEQFTINPSSYYLDDLADISDENKVNEILDKIEEEYQSTLNTYRQIFNDPALIGFEILDENKIIVSKSLREGQFQLTGYSRSGIPSYDTQISRQEAENISGRISSELPHSTKDKAIKINAFYDKNLKLEQFRKSKLQDDFNNALDKCKILSLYEIVVNLEEIIKTGMADVLNNIEVFKLDYGNQDRTGIDDTYENYLGVVDATVPSLLNYYDINNAESIKDNLNNIDTFINNCALLEYVDNDKSIRESLKELNALQYYETIEIPFRYDGEQAKEISKLETSSVTEIIARFDEIIRDDFNCTIEDATGVPYNEPDAEEKHYLYLVDHINPINNNLYENYWEVYDYCEKKYADEYFYRLSQQEIVEENIGDKIALLNYINEDEKLQNELKQIDGEKWGNIAVEYTFDKQLQSKINYLKSLNVTEIVKKYDEIIEKYYDYEIKEAEYNGIKYICLFCNQDKSGDNDWQQSTYLDVFDLLVDHNQHYNDLSKREALINDQIGNIALIKYCENDENIRTQLRKIDAEKYQEIKEDLQKNSHENYELNI